MNRAIILLSGGIDSATTLAVAKAEGYELYAISFDYGQRHKIELEAAIRIAVSLGVKKHIKISSDLREIGGSALTSDMEVPKKAAHDALKVVSNNKFSGSKPDLIPVTYVPARNTIFLSFALGWAEVLRAEDIFIGANAVDYSGYPDCRPEYLKAFEDMANLATKASVEGEMRFRVNAPLLYMTKADIIRKGFELGLNYALTWSCYDPKPASGNGFISCGRCDSCVFRAKGFTEAGIKDPLINPDETLI